MALLLSFVDQRVEVVTVPADQTTLCGILAEIAALPADWHGAGSLAPPALEAIVRHCSSIRIEHSAETGSGRSTLLFSHMSAHHEVFALDDGGSITKVLQSPLLNRTAVHYVEGPTQLTLPTHHFAHKLHAALIDGPHQYPCPDLEYSTFTGTSTRAPFSCWTTSTSPQSTTCSSSSRRTRCLDFFRLSA